MAASQEPTATMAPPESTNSSRAISNAGSTTASEPTLANGLKTIRPYDVTGIHLRPCSRDSLLAGMGAGFGVGGIRFIVGGGQFKAMNWAVGAFCLSSIGTYAFCQEKRRLEKLAMERAKEIMERKKAEKIEQERERRRSIMATREEERKSKGWLGFGERK